MSDSNLRSQLIRLAHANPELRADLLPILTASDSRKAGWKVPVVKGRPTREQVPAIRRSYLPPHLQDLDPIPTPPEAGVQAWLYESQSGTKTFYHVLAFAGNKSRPALFEFHRTQAGAEKSIQYLVNRQIESLDYKKLPASAGVENPYKVGDILYSSWGYEQTNVNFYEVVKSTSASISMREIESHYVSRSKVMPDPGDYKSSKVTTHRVSTTPYDIKNNRHPSVKINSYAVASKWDGNPVYRTPADEGY